MSTDSFIITKRDGSTEAFSVEKIKSAILKAFTSVNEPLDNDGLQKIVGQLKFCNGMSVEETMNTMLTKPPQNDFRLVGSVELPPMLFVPAKSHGYMVMEAQ